MTITDVHGLVKPLLRGRIHLAALVAAVPAGIVLVGEAGSAAARVGAAVYAVTLVALFAASSAYHRLGRTERSQRILRRLDHSSIYLLIAGSYTPLCLLAMRGWTGGLLLTAIWVTAVVGVVLKVGWFDRCNRIGGVLYIVMGWAAACSTPSAPSCSPPASPTRSRGCSATTRCGTSWSWPPWSCTTWPSATSSPPPDLDTLGGMCRRVQCPTCDRPTYAGCGNHVEQVLGDVAVSDRCRCEAAARPARRRRRWFARS